MSGPEDQHAVHSEWAKQLKELEKDIPNMTWLYLKAALIRAIAAQSDLDRIVTLLHAELEKREAEEGQ